MPKNLSVLLLALLFPGVCAAAGPAPPAEPTVAVRQQDGAFVLDISYRVPVSPLEAWAVLTDFENMPAFVPGVDSSRILQQSGNTLRVEQKGTVQFGLLSLHYESVREIETTPLRTIRSRTLSGDASVDSLMVLTPAGRDTVLSYHATAVSHLPLPDSLVGAQLGEMLQNQFRAMGREMLRRAQENGEPPVPLPAAQTAPPAPADKTAAKTAAPAKPSAKKVQAQTKKRPG